MMSPRPIPPVETPPGGVTRLAFPGGRLIMDTANSPLRVRVNDTDLAYLAEGSGEAVIFVHGSVNDYRAWRGQLGPFAEQYRVISYSRRFHWPNAKPDEETVYDANQHVSDLGALIETLGSPPVHLVGSSYGAMTALTLSVERPALVRSVVLGEPPLLPWLADQQEGAAVVEAFLTTAFGPARDVFIRGEAETGVRTFIDGVIGPGGFDRMPPPARQMMLDNAAAMRAETTAPPERYFPPLTADRVATLRVPVLLLEGAISPRMFGLITDRLARALPDAERITIPAASHGMHGQNPTAYNQAVLGFLARQRRPKVMG